MASHLPQLRSIMEMMEGRRVFRAWHRLPLRLEKEETEKPLAEGRQELQTTERAQEKSGHWLRPPLLPLHPHRLLHWVGLNRGVTEEVEKLLLLFRR